MAEKSKRVAVAYITDSQDNILMGKRNDNGLWSQPGGHIEVGECPYMGMARELKEEAGLDALDMKIVACKMVGNMLIYLFKCKVDPNQKIDTSNDPDKEFDNLEYIDPNDVREELHVPIERNVTLHYWINS